MTFEQFEWLKAEASVPGARCPRCVHPGFWKLAKRAVKMERAIAELQHTLKVQHGYSYSIISNPTRLSHIDGEGEAPASSPNAPASLPPPGEAVGDHSVHDRSGAGRRDHEKSAHAGSRRVTAPKG